MKTVKLSITGGRNDSMAQFYNCGKEGDELYAKAQELMDENDDPSVVSDFIDENFEEPDVEIFVHGLDEHSRINVCVEDENGETIFCDEEFYAYGTPSIVENDPREWEYDESMGDCVTSAIKKLVKDSDAKIASAIAAASRDDYDDFLEDYLASDVRTIIEQAPFAEAGFVMADLPDKKSPPALFATRCAELYGTGAMSCEIELADDEEFDIKKLKLIISDYDGYYSYCKDSILPVVQYGNKFYRLQRESWESHYDSYGFAQKDEGYGYFEFSMADE